MCTLLDASTQQHVHTPTDMYTPICLPAHIQTCTHVHILKERMGVGKLVVPAPTGRASQKQLELSYNCTHTQEGRRMVPDAGFCPSHPRLSGEFLDCSRHLFHTEEGSPAPASFQPDTPEAPFLQLRGTWVGTAVAIHPLELNDIMITRNGQRTYTEFGHFF